MLDESMGGLQVTFSESVLPCYGMVYVWYMYGISLDIPYICIIVDIPCISKDIHGISTKYIHDISMCTLHESSSTGLPRNQVSGR